MDMQANIETVKLGLAADLLRSGRAVRMRALGSSMLPSIWPGDLLIVANCQPSEVVVGDIVCFVRERRFVIHRVARIHESEEKRVWVTRGDGMYREDEPIQQEQLLGRVVAIERSGRRILPGRRFLLARYGWARILDVAVFRSLAFRLRATLRWFREPSLESLSG